MKIFLSPVAGQVVDVGASRAGGVALVGVDVDRSYRKKVCAAALFIVSTRGSPFSHRFLTLSISVRSKKSENFSKSRGRPSSRCRSVSGRPTALLRVDLAFDPIEKKVKIFLSPVAGQVVDVGASRAGEAALLRVDLGFGPIGEKPA